MKQIAPLKRIRIDVTASDTFTHVPALRFNYCIFFKCSNGICHIVPTSEVRGHHWLACKEVNKQLFMCHNLARAKTTIARACKSH